MHHEDRRTFRKIRALALSMAAISALALAGCSSPTNNSSGGGGGQTLTLATTAPPVSLNPATSTIYPPLAWYVQLSYEPLIRIDGQGNYVPDLATKWRYTNSDNTAFEVTLRHGVKFSDGDPLTAKAVVASVEYAKKSGVNGPAWMSGVSGITATSDDTVQFTLSSPSDQMPFLLSQRVMLGTIISPQGLANPSILKNSTHGAGPYVLDAGATVADSSYTYVPNKNYWDKSAIKWNKVVIKVVANTAAALQATESGQVDAFFGDISTAKAAQSSSTVQLLTRLTAIDGVNFLDANGTVSPPIGNVKVRRALSYAINRSAIAKGLFGSLGAPNATMTVKGLAGYSQEAADGFAYNPTNAKQLLAEAGYPNGFSFNMATSADGNAAQITQAIVQDWAKIGVKANLTTFTDDGQMVTAVLAHKYPVTLYDYGTLPMYVQSKSFFTGGATQYNAWNLQDAQLTSGLESAAAAKTFAEQSAGYVQVLNRAQQDLVWSTNVLSAPTLLIYNKTKLTNVDMSVVSPSPNVAWEVAPKK